MPVLQHNPALWKTAAAGGGSSYQIEKSLRFNQPDQAYLEGLGTSGNQRTFTISFWVKRSEIGRGQKLFTSSTDGSNFDMIYFQSTDELEWYSEGSDSLPGSSSTVFKTSAKFRDTSAWMHVVISVDTTQSVADDRVKVYINGKLATLGTYNAPAQNRTGFFNKSSKKTRIGANHDAQSNLCLQGYLANVDFIDGLALNPAAFGSFDSNTGVWNPKAFALPSRNQGVTQSSVLTSSSGAFRTTAPAIDLFDQRPSYGASTSASSGGTITWTPATDMPFTQGVRCKAGESGVLFTLTLADGSEHKVQTAASGSGGIWHTLYEGAGSIEKITCYAASTYQSWDQIEVDGIWIQDSITDVETRDNPNTGVNWVTAGTNAASGGEIPNAGSAMIVDVLGHDDGDDPDLAYYNPTWGNFETVFNGILDNTNTNRILTAGGQYPGSGAGVGGDWTRLRLSVGHISAGIKRLRIWTRNADGTGNQTPYQVKLLDSSKSQLSGTATTVLPNTGITSMHWENIPLGTATATDIKYIEFSYSGAGSNWSTEQPRFYWGGLEINGHVIVDNSVDNSFRLKFNDISSAAALGHSSLPLDVNDPNKGGPILKTTDTSSGRTLDSGYNTDSNASSLVLAIPGNAAVDESNHINNSSSEKTITYTAGAVAKTDQSRYYGTSTYCTGGARIVSSQTNDCRFSGECTLEGWFRLADGTVNNSVLMWSGGTGNGRYLIWTKDSELTLVVYDGNTPTQRFQGSTVISADVWHHFAICRDSSDLVSGYLDGKLEGTWDSSSYGSDLGGDADSTAPEIGSQSGGNNCTGWFQDFRFYSTCKYTGEFQPQAPNDFTVNNLTTETGSSGIASGTGPGTSTSYTYFLDANTNTNGYFNTSTTTSVTWSSSKPTWSSSLKVEINTGGGSPVRWRVNSGSWTDYTLYNGKQTATIDSGSGTLTKIEFQTNQGGGGNLHRLFFDDVAYNIADHGGWEVTYTDADIDSFTDSPTNYGTDTGAGGEVRGSFCTWDPLSKGSDMTLSQGNLKIDTTSTAWTNANVVGTIGATTGKWYWEVNGTDAEVQLGIHKGIAPPITSTNFVHAGGTGYALYNLVARAYHDSSYKVWGSTWGAGDVIGVALDLDTGALWFSKNGAWTDASGTSNSATVKSQLEAGTTTNATYTWTPSGEVFRPCIAFRLNPDSGASDANFGQRAFKYTAPSGFKALCTQNLDDTFSGEAAGTVNNPSKYFDVLTYTGTGSSHAITGLNFGPDLVWIKKRNATSDHALFDQIRGVHERLYPNDSSGEDTQTNTLTAFGTGGFTLGDMADVNADASTYVSWNWDAGTAAVTPSSSYNITPTGQWINATAGFSITGYTGNGSDDQTLPHGLNAVPNFVIVKNRDGSGSWQVKHSNLTAGKVLTLHLNYAEGESSFGEIKDLDSNVTVTLDDTGNNATNVNNDGDKYTLYAWTAISGYSAFGTFEGNDNANGPFIYTGFKPRWLLIKDIDDAREWTLWDTERRTFNPQGPYLLAHTSAADAAQSERFDILANGFKIRSTAGFINAAETFIYAAFAEHPLKTARAQ